MAHTFQVTEVLWWFKIRNNEVKIGNGFWSLKAVSM